MCDKQFQKMVEHESIFLTATKIKKCVIKLLKITLMHQNLFLNALRLKKCFFKPANTYASTLKSVPELFLTQKMCDKAIYRCFFVFDSIPNQHKTQVLCSTGVSEDPF